MAPILIAALVAGAYFLGKRKEDKQPKALPPAPSPYNDLPPPPPPGPAPGPTPDVPEDPSLGQSNYRDLWELTTFEVEIYPAGSRKTAIPPPTMPDSVSASPGCTILAIGELWWERAGEYARSFIDQGYTSRNEVRAMILQYLAPECLDPSSGAGAAALNEELNERLSALLPHAGVDSPDLGMGSLPSVGTPAVPVGNPARRSARAQVSDSRSTCPPCAPPQSFNPWPIYASAAYRKSSITNYYAQPREPINYVCQRNPRVPLTRRRRTIITR